MAELVSFGVGVATADAELRQVGQNGASVCTVNLAFNRNYQDKNKEWQTETCFIKAQIWGNKSTKMAELVKRGQPIYVHGHLKQETWEDKNKQKRISYSLNLRDFQLCEKNGKRNGDNTSQPTVATTNTETPAAAPVAAQVPDNDTIDDMDIPF